MSYTWRVVDVILVGLLLIVISAIFALLVLAIDPIYHALF